MKRLSIRLRLTALNAIVLLAAFAVTGVGGWFAIRDSVHDSIDDGLRAHLESLRADSSKSVQRHEGAVPADWFEGMHTTDVSVRVADGRRWIYQSPGAPRLITPPPDTASLPPDGQTRTTTADGHPMRVLEAPMSIGGRTWAVEIGTRIDEFEEILDQFAGTVALASPVVLLLASVAGYWMSRGALEPVERITRAATSIGAHSLSERLPVRGIGDELDRLSETLNGMFARLDDAFRRVSQFTADASHELRTPLAVIQTAAEVSRQRPRTESEYIETLDRILIETGRTSRIIDDLLFLARADADDALVAMEALDLGEVLREACNEARVLAEAAGLRLSSTLSVACPMMGDPQGLHRLFLILLDNAIKYTPAGGAVNVTMSISGQTAVVEIRDTGIGIGAEDLPHLFERFYRVASDRSRSSGGVGLGLAIAKWIATCHHGEIAVESQPGAGSIFRVVLPIVMAVEQ